MYVPGRVVTLSGELKPLLQGCAAGYLILTEPLWGDLLANDT